MNLRVAAAALVATAWSAAFAMDDADIVARYSPAFKACTENPMPMRVLQECNAREIEYQQDALNREFQALLAAWPHDRDRLQAEEDRWRDKTSAACGELGLRQGSLNSLKAEDCFLTETIKRRIDIKTSMP
jgi:uncharacterized protein YecT (DUF1311 family)